MLGPIILKGQYRNQNNFVRRTKKSKFICRGCAYPNFWIIIASSDRRPPFPRPSTSSPNASRRCRCGPAIVPGPASILVREQTVFAVAGRRGRIRQEFDCAFTWSRSTFRTAHRVTQPSMSSAAVAAESFEQFQPLHYELAGLRTNIASIITPRHARALIDGMRPPIVAHGCGVIAMHIRRLRPS